GQERSATRLLNGGSRRVVRASSPAEPGRGGDHEAQVWRNPGARPAGPAGRGAGTAAGRRDGLRRRTEGVGGELPEGGDCFFRAAGEGEDGCGKGASPARFQEAPGADLPAEVPGAGETREG